MEKKNFVLPEVVVIAINTDDIITTSVFGKARPGDYGEDAENLGLN